MSDLWSADPSPTRQILEPSLWRTHAVIMAVSGDNQKIITYSRSIGQQIMCTFKLQLCNVHADENTMKEQQQKKRNVVKTRPSKAKVAVKNTGNIQDLKSWFPTAHSSIRCVDTKTQRSVIVDWTDLAGRTPMVGDTTRQFAGHDIWYLRTNHMKNHYHWSLSLILRIRYVNVKQLTEN